MQIKEICDKYGIDDVYERFVASSGENIEVGFLGEFSSGKSSLLNSLLGQNLLIVDSAPTTKTIISVGYGDKEQFFKLENNAKAEIGKAEFDELQLNGNSKLYVQLQHFERERERE